MKSLKKNLFLVISISISLLFGTLGTIFFSNAFKTIYAEEAYVLEIAKLTLYQNAEQQTDENLYYYDGSKFVTATLDNLVENKPFDLDSYAQYNVISQKMDYAEEDNVFMLNNANRQIVSGPINESSVDTQMKAKQFLLVRFLPNQNSADENVKYDFVNLSVNATLSGSHYSIDPVNISSLEKTSSSTNQIYYAKFFDLENTYLLDTTAQDGIGEHLNEYDAQGKYTFNFIYSIRDKQGNVTTNLNKTTEFYLLSENYYINKNADIVEPRSNVASQELTQPRYLKTFDTNYVSTKTYYTKSGSNYVKFEGTAFESNVDYYEQFTYNTVYNTNYNTNNIYTEPRLFNTERIDRLHYGAGQLEQNFFSYSNQITVDYNGKSNNQNGYLYYPTLKYDASKYNLTCEKTKAGVTYTITTSLDTTGAYPKLILTEKNSLGNIISVKEMTDVASYDYTFQGKTYTGYIATLVFENVGKYILHFDYVLNNYAIDSKPSKLLNIEKQNWNKIGSDQLTIFGYQLMHSDYKNVSGATEKEMKYLSYEKITDYTTFDTFNTYEYNEQNDIYYSTLDTSYVYKKYYKVEQIDKDSIAFDANNTYEKDGDEYVLTEDQSYNNEKDYYRFIELNVPSATFVANNTYEKDENGYYLTEDTKYETAKSYFKLNELFADVTNKNIDENGKVLGQEINAITNVGNSLIAVIDEKLEEGFDKITTYAVIKVTPTTPFVADKTYELKYVLTEDTGYVDGKNYYKKEGSNYNPINPTETIFDPNNTYEYKYALTADTSYSNIKTYYTKCVISVNKTPYTNQAPLFFNYYSEIKGNTDNNFYYHYTKTGTTYSIDKQNGSVIKYSLKNNSNSRFTDNGLYVVVISYDMPDYEVIKDQLESSNSSKTHTKVQVFVFEIANIEPNVKINPVENNTDLDFGPRGYTNNSVKIDWSKAIESPFDVAPQIRVFKQAFGENQQAQDITNTLDREQLEHGFAIVEDSAIYSIRIDYGPCTPQLDGTYLYSASITTTFIIDKEAIDSMEFFEITNEYKSLTQKMTNKNFALIYGNISEKEVKDNYGTVTGTTKTGNGLKNSEATISVTYTFMPINAGIDQEIVAPIDTLGNYIANNKSITQINENITYNQKTISDNLTSADENVLSNDGIYIFTFTDEAGNSATRYLFKDTTKPIVLQQIEGELNYTIVPSSSANEDNIVNQNTKLVWGTHKAIKVSNEILTSTTIANEDAFKDNIFEDADNKAFILVENNTNYASAVNNIYANDVLTKENIAICFKNADADFEKLKPVYAIQNRANYTILARNNNEIIKEVIDGKTVYPTEHLYRFAVSDKLGNRFNGLLEMSFDNSALQAHVVGAPSNNVQTIGINSQFKTNGDGTKQRLYEDSISNKKTLSFSWIAGEGDFEVVSVVANFYPLTYETDSPNYPYAATPQQFNLMEHTTTETIGGVTKTKSAEINLVQDERYGEQSTVQGYYEVIRTYRNDIEDPRHYNFYIDRNNLISYEEGFDANNNYIGDKIAIALGDNINKYQFAGSEFLQEFITEYVLQSNKQPAEINTPKYKYSYLNNSNRIGKMGFHQLFCEIRDVNGNVIQNSLLNKSGLYTIKIYDNSYDEGLVPEYCTSIEFKVYIDLYAPMANFVDEDGQIMTVSNQNSNLSTNNTKVNLNWEKIDQYAKDAKIDEKNITITKTTESGAKTVIYKIVDNTVTINPARINENIVKEEDDEYYIDLSVFDSLIKENCKIEITLKYQTDNEENYGNYISSTKVIFFDFEKPKTNYYKLLDNDKYLSAEIKASAKNAQDANSFDNYNATINFENYAFVLSNTYRFTTPPASSFWQEGIEGATSNPNDVQTVWYRKYNKYADQTGVNAQSIVPGDDRYDDMTKAPTRYRFNPNTKINGEWLYTQIYTSLEDFDLSLLDSNSYYEIIEMDCAGNYRIYTIYIPENNRAEIQYQIKYNDENITDTIYAENPTISNSYEIDSQVLDILNISNIGEWYNISVSDGSTGRLVDNVIKIAPEEFDGYVTKSVGLRTLNQLIKDNEEVGRYFVISITSSLFEPIIINFHTPGIGFELDFNISTVLTVTIDQNKYEKVTYVKTFKVYENNQQDGTRKLLDKDNNNKVIQENYSLEDNIVSYTFTYSTQNPRHLWFEYTDNFGKTYQENKILGITQTPFEEMLTFTSGNYIKNPNFKPEGNWEAGDKYAEYYTNSIQAIMKYQPLLYPENSIEIHKVGEEEEHLFAPVGENIKEIRIFDLDDEFGTNETYIITFNDTSGHKYMFKIHHYSKLAELNFVDSNGYPHYFDDSNNDTYESSISRVVYLQFEKIDTSVSYPIETSVRITRTYYDSNNIKLVQDYGYINEQFEFKDYGIYNITAKNSLGTSKTYHFELIKSEATYYSVKVIVNGRTVLLSPSSEKLSKGNVEYEHYLSIYNATIDVNQERNLKYEEEEGAGEDSITRYYKISSINETFNYEKYIAITKIPVSSNILGGRMYLNEQNVTGSNRYLKTNEKTVVLTIPAYSIPDNDREGAVEANKLKVRVVYGSTDLGYVEGVIDRDNLNIEFTSAGTYYIYISDFAGNSHSFGGTAFYTLSLVNNFVYKLNGETGIYNSVFNDTVNLSVVQTDSFVRDNNGNRFTITATLNGNNYVPTFVNGSYVFNSYGTYYVTLKGYINDNTKEENLVQTELKFTILNPNEAKLMHEYIGLNGYEVVKIEKNGNDITNLIKEQIGVGTINQFAIFGGQDGVGGNGNYVITVSAQIDKIIGEKEFNYSVWINKDTDILILCDLAEGDSTTKNIHLKMNLYQIYSKVGECKIKLNGDEFVSVNSSSAAYNGIITYTLKQNMRYNITLETNSGNTIMSFVVTKIEPLNTVAIVVIVIASVVAAGLIITFIVLRKKMRVK